MHKRNVTVLGCEAEVKGLNQNHQNKILSIDDVTCVVNLRMYMHRH